MLLFTRISPISIIGGHFSTLYDSSTGKLSIIEIGFLLAFCLSMSGLTWFFAPAIPSGLSSALLNFFAIVGGFLVSALFVVGSYGDSIWSNRANLTSDELARAKKVQKEIVSNVSFGVLLAFFGAFLCVLLVFNIEGKFVASMIVFTVALFFHTLLMVLKRLEALFVRMT